MMSKFFFSAALATLAFCFTIMASQAQSESMDGGSNGSVLVTKKELAWTDGPPALPPGAKMAIIHGDPAKPGLFTMRIRVPNGYSVPPHWHPADEHVTVIKGTFNMGHGNTFDKEKSKALPVGSFARMPKREHHFAWVKGETEVQIHAMGPWGINYVNPADGPRKKK